MYEGYTILEDGTVIGKMGWEMKPQDNKKGYLVLGLMVDGKRITKAIHRLVAEVHIPNPLNKPEVDHIDGNRQNNHISNLRWATKSENNQHSYNLGNKTSKGEMNGRCQTTEEEVVEICKYISEGISSAAIRDKGYDYNLVRAIKRKKNWTYISSKYF